MGIDGSDRVEELLRQPLLGRGEELEHLHHLVDQVRIQGSALVLRGEAGIGKSALLKAASDGARETGVSVVAIAGTQSETRLPFGGLHQLLLPFLDRLGHLPDSQRNALHTAFGIGEGDAPDGFMIGLATLGVLAEQATRTPLLLVIDDAHWLDRSSAEVLAFVARRINEDPVVLLFGVRDGVLNDLDEAGLPTLTVGGLDDDASRVLLALNGSELTQDLQTRILQDAAGNPLALIELPMAAVGLGPGQAAQQPLPLPARLEAAFATRLTALDDHVRCLLLLAALGDGELDEANRAAEELLAVSADTNSWTMAVSSGLGTIGDGRFHFRHPLMRSAVHHAATSRQRRAAHAALARTLAGDPDRAVWHQAAATLGSDEGVATALEVAAARALARGGVDVACAAFERAAELTDDPRTRALRLMEAGQLAFQLGRADEGVPLLREALRLGLPRHHAVRTSFELEGPTSTWSGASAIPDFARIAREFADSGDDDQALATIEATCVRAHWGPLDDETRHEVSAIVAGLAVPGDDPFRISVLALVDPVSRGREVIGRLSRLSPAGFIETDDLLALGRGASAVWADNLAVPFLRMAVAGYRADGRAALLVQALVFEAWADVRSGAVRVAVSGAAEGVRLAEETRDVRFLLAGKLAQAIAAAEMGDEEGAESLIAEAEAALLPMGTNPLLALVALARGKTALSAERPGEAYADLVRIYTPSDSAFQPFVRGWALADLVDAAVHGDGDLALVAGFISEWRAIAADTNAPHLLVQLSYADALLAEDETAEESFQEAMTSGSVGWPYYAARTQLAYGQWLRRQRREVDARLPLREAAHSLEALGLRRLADRALRELRASGERTRRRAPEAWTELSPQELQIAQLAADGRTNREIGERLYLSHRTVGTHLYRLFPKLGITSRAQLRDALDTPRTS